MGEGTCFGHQVPEGATFKREEKKKQMFHSGGQGFLRTGDTES